MQSASSSSSNGSVPPVKEEMKWADAMGDFNMHFVAFVHPIYHLFKTLNDELSIIGDAHRLWATPASGLLETFMDTQGSYNLSRLKYVTLIKEKFVATTRLFDFDPYEALEYLSTETPEAVEAEASRNLRWKKYCDAVLDLFITEYHSFVRSGAGAEMKVACSMGTVDTISICRLLLDALTANAENSSAWKRISPRSFKNFLFWVHQLILLAGCCKGVTSEQVKQLLEQHARVVKSIATATTHSAVETKTSHSAIAINDPTSSSSSDSDSCFYDVCKWHNTKEMIEIVDSCVEKPIPSPLIGIVNSYCEIDPLSNDDDEFIVRKLLNKLS